VANLSNPTSQVFIGENASNMEMLMQRMTSLGYGIIRIQWDGSCASGSDGPYSDTNLQRAIQLAQHYNMWIVAGIGTDNDMTSANLTCWLSEWSPIISAFKNGFNGYNNIVWTPENEPTGLDVSTLSSSYQAFINQTRSLGDTHWIVVENLCDFSCPYSGIDEVQGYPNVTDPLNMILISLHSYFGWQFNSNNWNNASAETSASNDFQVVQQGSVNTGWQILNTEGGADPQVVNCTGPPDCVLSGSAGYSITTLHYIQTLTNLYNSKNIDWMWFPAASWTDTPNAGIYGALADNGWGNEIAPNSSLPPGNLSLNWSGVPIIVEINQSSTRQSCFFLNNVGTGNVTNVFINVSGIPSSWFTLQPTFISNFASGTSLQVCLNFSIPLQANVQDYTVITVASSNASANTSFTLKVENQTIIQMLKNDALLSIIKAGVKINESLANGTDVTYAQQLFDTSIHYYDEQQFYLAKQYADQSYIEAFNALIGIPQNQTVSQGDALVAINNASAKINEATLKKVKIPEAEDLLNISKQYYNQSNYTYAKLYADLAYQSAESAIQNSLVLGLPPNTVAVILIGTVGVFLGVAFFLVLIKGTSSRRKLFFRHSFSDQTERIEKVYKSKKLTG